MQHYKNLNDLIEKSPTAYKFYSGLPYDVQQMLDESNRGICTENELVNYVENYIGTEYR